MARQKVIRDKPETKGFIYPDFLKTDPNLVLDYQ